MRDFFNSTRFKIFAVIALVLLGLMIRSATNGGLAAYPASGISVVVSPVQKLSSKVSGFFSDVFGNIASFNSMKSENAKLQDKINDFESRLVDYNEMQRENEQLMQIYDLHKENPDLKLKPAGIISREPSQWFSSFTIDAGSLDGIADNDPVITPKGLVGLVTKTLPTSAVVTTILDPSVSAGILISETGDTGVTQGVRSLISDGNIQISYLPKDSSVSVGNIVVTSGRGGIFPKNLKVGTILDVTAESSGMSLYAVCKPMVNPSSVKSVFVITDFNGKSVFATSSPSSGGK